MSSHNIDKGANWGAELSNRLQSTSFGISCLTPENLAEPWLNYEAGAISKIEGARLCTLLIDLTPSDVSFPLAQFQATLATKEDVFQLMQTINVACASERLPEGVLLSAFEVWWPKLEEKLNNLPKEDGAPKAKRPDRDILEEILEAVRAMNRSTSSQPAAAVISVLEAQLQLLTSYVSGVLLSVIPEAEITRSADKDGFPVITFTAPGRANKRLKITTDLTNQSAIPVLLHRMRDVTLAWARETDQQETPASPGQVAHP